MNYPLPYWWDFTVSGPTLPSLYWNVKSQEERIKKICEDLWKLIQLYKLVCDAINDHEKRIQALEDKVKELENKITNLVNLYNQLKQMVENLDQRVDNVEQQIENINQSIQNLNNRINQLITDLPDMIKNLIINNDEIRQTIKNIVNDLIRNKMDKVPDAVANNIAVFNDAGQVIDGGKKISDLATKLNITNKVDKVPMAADQMLVSDGNGGIKNSGLAFNKRFIEAPNEANVKTLSTSNPNSIVYIPETE